MRKLIIGLDFHGVIVDVQLVKQKIAWELTGRFVPLAFLKHELAVPTWMSHEQYKEMNRRIYEEEQLLGATAMEGAWVMIQQFLAAGHEVDIITACGEEAFPVIIEWLKRHHFDAPGIRLVGIGRNGDKADPQHTRAMDAYLDDDMESLTRLKKLVERLKLTDRPLHLVLMSRAYNLHEQVTGALRVNGWHAFRRFIRKLAHAA